MQFEETTLTDAWLIRIESASDERGSFARTFCVREFAQHGLEMNYPQHSISTSRQMGTLRGMHYQREPHAEAKLVRCVKGAIWDVIIDIRPDSPTYCLWQAFELSDVNNCQLYVPKGFAHGFQTLRSNVEVSYLISEFYSPEASVGIRYNDSTFAIAWPLPINQISKKDTRWPDFRRQTLATSC